jgi:hypothetical protein
MTNSHVITKLQETTNMILDNIDNNINKEYNATVLIFIGVLTNNKDLVEKGIDNGGDLNYGMTSDIKLILCQCGILEDTSI